MIALCITKLVKTVKCSGLAESGKSFETRFYELDGTKHQCAPYYWSPSSDRIWLTPFAVISLRVPQCLHTGMSCACRILSSSEISTQTANCNMCKQGGSVWNPNSNTRERVLPQHDRLVACVIAQQCSPTTAFYLYTFISGRKYSVSFEVLFLKDLSVFKIGNSKACNRSQSESVCTLRCIKYAGIIFEMNFLVYCNLNKCTSKKR